MGFTSESKQGIKINSKAKQKRPKWTEQKITMDGYRSRWLLIRSLAQPTQHRGTTAKPDLKNKKDFKH